MNNSGQAIAERNLNEQRVEFEKWARSKYLDVRRTTDAWDRLVYHPHIECMWEGWKARAGAFSYADSTTPFMFSRFRDALKKHDIEVEKVSCVKAPANQSGYHLTEIPKGTLGDMSKIEEEFAEFKDAMSQDNRIMALQELSDLIGAIEAFTVNKHNVTLSDLIQMKNATKRAFESGHRK